jgi:hypothetical protein
MNDSTLCVIRGFQGDAHQIAMMMPHHKKHGCHILVQSPDDSQIGYESFPGITDLTCWSAGRRAYIGQLSLDRERAHLEQCLKFPHKFFLLHDADSVCLQPEFPKYLYDQPDVIFGQIVANNSEEHKVFFSPPHMPRECPRIAIQPPYFVSRSVIERIVNLPPIFTNPVMPFIDFLWVQFAMATGLVYKHLRPGASFETSTPLGRHFMHQTVRDDGVVFCHSIKSQESLDAILHARQEYLRNHPTAPR